MITWSDTVHATQNGNVQCMHHYWNPKMISLTDLNINLLRATVHHNQCSNGPRPVNRLGRLNGQLLACLLQWSFHLNNRTFFKLSLACFHFEGNRCCKTLLWVLYLYLWLKTDAFRLQSKYLIFSRYKKVDFWRTFVSDAEILLAGYTSILQSESFYQSTWLMSLKVKRSLFTAASPTTPLLP